MESLRLHLRRLHLRPPDGCLPLCALCCTRVPPATDSSQLTRILALVFVWRPMPATLRSVLRTCLSGGRCLRMSLTVSAQDVLACGRHLIDGVLHLTIALLPRDKCCCDTADKRFRPHASERTRLTLLQDILVFLTVQASHVSNNTLDVPKRMAPRKPRWQSLLQASFISKSRTASTTTALVVKFASSSSLSDTMFPGLNNLTVVPEVRHPRE